MQCKAVRATSPDPFQTHNHGTYGVSQVYQFNPPTTACASISSHSALRCRRHRPPPQSVSAPCRDQPCLALATSALAPSDAPNTLRNTLTPRPTSPVGACLSLPRGSGYEHSTTQPLHNSTFSDKDKDPDRVIAHHPAHFHLPNKERPPSALQITPPAS